MARLEAVEGRVPALDAGMAGAAAFQTFIFTVAILESDAGRLRVAKTSCASTARSRLRKGRNRNHG
ncbi:hypothetical protein [Longimicrobium sp.]|uniref:hypothetical protein n=1 Tax=Longimicrobium sp. TaxID=2029185 RepID=UPI002E376094|nr:hypothetical protein [Longimicrobium sp.]HEX6036786.1 hypothetical protein [Longimicrobium sp.]